MALRIWVGTDPGNEGLWGTANNWAPAVVPVDGDDVRLTDSSQGVTGDLNQSAVTLATLHIDQSYTGNIGFLSSFLRIGATIVRIGFHSGTGSPAGSGRINLDLGTPISAVLVNATKTVPTDTNRTSLRLKAVNVGTTVTIRGGSVSVADDPADASTVDTIDMSADNAAAGIAEVIVGDSVTVENVKVDGGTCLLFSLPTVELESTGGTTTTEGTAGMPLVTMREGTLFPNATGEIVLLKALGGLTDFRTSNEARQVGTLEKSAGASVALNPAEVTVVTEKTLGSEDVVVTVT